MKLPAHNTWVYVGIHVNGRPIGTVEGTLRETTKFSWGTHEVRGQESILKFHARQVSFVSGKNIIVQVDR